MSSNPLVPAKPAEITLDTLPELFAHHRARFGGWQMTATPPEPDPPSNPPPADQPPAKPEGIAEEEWNALGDPGKRAIVRERTRADTAERSLAAARARPAPPKQDPPPSNPQSNSPPADPPKPKEGDPPDFEALIQKAVDAAVKPFADKEQQRETEAAADKVRQAVLDAAKPRLHDATDALAGIELASVVDDQGRADTEKVKSALDDLVTRKPHLAKTGQERQAPPGIGGGAPPGQTDGEKVKSVLADMQRATGVRSPTASSTQ